MRPAIAARCTIAFVDPPTASSTRMAFSNDPIVKNPAGAKSLAAISTAKCPVASAMRRRSADTAGAQAPPASIKPSVSVISAIVLAVPITPQVPIVGTSWLFASAMAASSRSPARYCAHSRRQSVQAPTRSPKKLPVSIGPLTSWTKGSLALSAPIICAGTVLSHPPTKMQPSSGNAFIISSVSIAIRLRRYIDVG